MEEGASAHNAEVHVEQAVPASAEQPLPHSEEQPPLESEKQPLPSSEEQVSPGSEEPPVTASEELHPGGLHTKQPLLASAEVVHEEHDEQLVVNVSTRASTKDPSVDDSHLTSDDVPVPGAEQHVQEEVVQEGDLVRTVSSRHSRKSVSHRDRTESQSSAAQPRMSTTPSKEADESEFHEETYRSVPETPSTHDPDSPQPPFSARQPSPRNRKVAEKRPPIGHSVLCMSQYRNSPRHSFQPPLRNGFSNVPGPGTYTPAKPAPTETCALVTERPETWKENKYPGPRPGSYEVKSFIADGSRYSIGVPRFQPVRKGPGPGQYDPQETPSKGDNYSLGKGCTGRTDGVRNQNPGPGQYEHTSYNSRLKAQSPQYSLAGAVQREKDPRYEQRPGPTRYDQVTSMGSGKKVSVGMPRRDGSGHNFPGPGHYGGHYSTFHLS